MLLDDLRLSVIEVFLGNYVGSFTGSYIARKKSLNQKTVANTLNKLEDEGFLKSTTVGRNKEFSLNLDNLESVKNLIVAVEHLRTANFLKKNPMVKEILLKAKLFLKGIVVVFGSYAKGTQKKDSDLDIFVGGTYNRDKIYEISKLYGIQVNVKNYSPDAFRRVLKTKDVLINEILKNHIIITSIEEFVNMVLREYYGQD